MYIVHPQYAILIIEVNELREQIADFIVERDFLKYYVCKDIEIDYMLKIGALEYKLIVAKNNYEKSLRKLEILKQKIEKKQKINLEAINKKIKREFKENTKIEQEMSENIDFAIEISSFEIIDYEAIEQANVDYFKLQKMYNPIFNLESLEEDYELLKKIENMYKKRKFKKISKLAEKYDPDYIYQDEISNLKKLKKKYTHIREDLKKEIRKFKNGFPYNQKVILEDENLCRRKKDSLNREIISINTETEKINKKINDKIRKTGIKNDLNL